MRLPSGDQIGFESPARTEGEARRDAARQLNQPDVGVAVLRVSRMTATRFSSGDSQRVK